jgi:hypothetical protein
MANFYYGSDSGQNYWINLNPVSHMKLENDKIILKMLMMLLGLNKGIEKHKDGKIFIQL